MTCSGTTRLQAKTLQQRHLNSPNAAEFAFDADSVNKVFTVAQAAQYLTNTG